MCKKQRFFIELSYHGQHYHGWQYQPNAIAVQEKLDQALSNFFGEKIETLGCGRTDTGVHATQFFAHFDIATEFSEQKQKRFLKSINAMLPYDIAVKHMVKVHEDAHARFDAIKRSYEYHIHFHKNPFKTHTSWLVPDLLDITEMNKAAAYLLEYKDFGAFCKANAANFTNICDVSRAEWIKEGNAIVFHITANRFLRNMVRAIVGTLVDIGKGKHQAQHIRSVIESKSRAHAGASVPACGLFLTEVSYPYIVKPFEEILNNE